MSFKTTEVYIGNIPLGDQHPVRIQTMTNTHTEDVDRTVDQCKRIIKIGTDYIRITVPSLKDVENFRKIKVKLIKQGFKVPLIADVHFNPRVAEKVAAVAEKIRVNPGNYADKKISPPEDPDKTSNTGPEKIKTLLLPLIKVCKEHNTAIRVGTNHGSLSPRIMAKYGDTPEGMAESAMEFLRVLHGEDFHNIVLSMKASNTLIMIHATRLLMKKMLEENMVYPVHLGVTEAGEGEDGRVKSAVGIGTLLLDGIGDTIRVSLSEDPEKELPVAREIVNYCSRDGKRILSSRDKILSLKTDFTQRSTHRVMNIGGSNPPLVVGNQNEHVSPDIIILEKYDPNINLNENQIILLSFDEWQNAGKPANAFPLYKPESFKNSNLISKKANFIELTNWENYTSFLLLHANRNDIVLIHNGKCLEDTYAQNDFFQFLDKNNILTPVIIKRIYNEPDKETFLLKSSIDAGYIFTGGHGNGLWLENVALPQPHDTSAISFSILQACRQRFVKTEYITCPSCGRTRFNLPETIQKVKAKTSHLKDLKIAIMGCIVNGPGEMADADYGYVGSGQGKISLYKGKEIIKKNIPEENAVDELVNLIQSSGDWYDNH